jgi:hypothetical protein
VAQDDPAPVLSLAEWRPLPIVSRGLILRTLGHLFSWRRIPRENVVQTLRQAFEIGIPASDLDLWDAVLDACLIVHPREVMPYLRRQLSPAICRKLEITRADLENVSMMPMERLVADVRARSAGPTRGWEDFVPIVTSQGRSPEYDDEISEIKPVHVGPKTGRNDPCPCGSGRKFKKCCGAGQ